MAVKGGGKIITDGLILALDVSSDRCYSSGSMLDLSGNGTNYEMMGWTLTEASGAISLIHSESVSVDSAYIRSTNISDGTITGSVAYLNIHGDFTLEFWAMGTATPTDGAQQCGSTFSENDNATGNGAQMQINLGYGSSPPSNAIRFYGSQASAVGTFLLGGWRHYAMTCEANGVASGSYYEDGVLTSSPFAVGSWATNTGNTYHYLMRDLDDINNFAGHFGSVKMYNRQLTASEILENYTNTKGKYF